MRARLVLAVLVATACSQPPVPVGERASITPEYQPAALISTGGLESEPIHVHVDVSPAMAPDVIAGIRAWADATHDWKDWELAGPAGANLMITEVPGGGSECAPVGYPIAGCAGAIGGLDKDPPFAKVWLIRGSYEAAAKWVVMHEVGHALGLTHLDGTLMAQHADAALVLSSWDCPDEVSLLRVSWRIGVRLGCR